MNGPIAQAAALAVYGNEYLRGSVWSAFWPSANVFKYCKYVHFLDGGETLADPPAWFAALKASGVSGLRLHHVAGKQAIGSDRELAGFVGGGGRWLIEAIAPQASAIWEAGWRVAPKDEHGSIWEVEYRCIAPHSPRPPHQDVDRDALRARLRSTLSQIAAFATQQKLDWFATAFENARRKLENDAPLSEAWGGDFAHATLPLAGQQLLGAAAAAWVFGGMGSWNDQGFESKADDAEYKRLSDQLWVELCDSVCAAANSPVPAG